MYRWGPCIHRFRISHFSYQEAPLIFLYSYYRSLKKSSGSGVEAGENPMLNIGSLLFIQVSMGQEPIPCGYRSMPVCGVVRRQIPTPKISHWGENRNTASSLPTSPSLTLNFWVIFPPVPAAHSSFVPPTSHRELQCTQSALGSPSLTVSTSASVICGTPLGLNRR